VRSALAIVEPVPGRRGLQVCLGLLWLLDAALQYQPFMFGPGFVTRGIEPAAAGNPAAIIGSVTWASHLMLRHMAVYNAMFASIQLLLAIGFFFRRTVKLALAASIVWALSVWWFGESLGGILTGTSPLAGLPGAVVLYALIAIMLWPTRAGAHEPTSAAAAGILGNTGANLVWLALWGGFAHYLLLPANRASDAITHIFSAADGQPRWVAATMTLLAHTADQRGTQISVVLAVTCAGVALGVFSRRAMRPALVIAAGIGLLFWIAEGLGGIFTGEGTDPNTGPLLILLAACYWPARPSPRHRPPVSQCAPFGQNLGNPFLRTNPWCLCGVLLYPRVGIPGACGARDRRCRTPWRPRRQNSIREPMMTVRSRGSRKYSAASAVSREVATKSRLRQRLMPGVFPRRTSMVDRK
jgi:hypothetical protein